MRAGLQRNFHILTLVIVLKFTRCLRSFYNTNQALISCTLMLDIDRIFLYSRVVDSYKLHEIDHKIVPLVRIRETFRGYVSV